MPSDLDYVKYNTLRGTSRGGFIFDESQVEFVLTNLETFGSSSSIVIRNKCILVINFNTVFSEILLERNFICI